MKIILLVGFVLISVIALIWAIGVALQEQVFDHEEVRRISDEWEEME